jgi:transcriptional regulator NrdR family protein
MNCPLCHADTLVIRTDGNRRRRECVNCRYRWNTVELAEPEVNRLRRVAEVAAEMTNALRENGVAELSR